MFPELSKTEKRIQLGCCGECATVRAFTVYSNADFPSTGWWIECLVCKQYRYYFKIVRGRIVTTNKTAGKKKRH